MMVPTLAATQARKVQRNTRVTCRCADIQATATPPTPAVSIQHTTSDSGSRRPWNTSGHTPQLMALSGQNQRCRCR